MSSKTECEDEGSSRAIIIDTGSFTTKAMWNNEDEPSCVVPTTFCQRRRRLSIKTVGSDPGMDERHVSSSVFENTKYFDLWCAMKNGEYMHWGDFEKMCRQIFFSSLKVEDLSEHPVMTVEHISTPKQNRERMTQILFETFAVGGYYTENDVRLSMYSTGHVSGLGLVSGHQVTSVAPIYEGYTLPDATKRSDIAGEFLTKSILKKKFPTLDGEYITEMSEIRERHIRKLDDIKKLAYVDLPEGQKAEDRSKYELPDGGSITLDRGILEHPRVLFKTSLEMIESCIEKVDKDIVKLILSNIICSGGSTKFDGFPERIEEETRGLAIIQEKMGKTVPVKVHAPPKRENLPCIGGATLASLDAFQKNWITKAEYEDCGPSIVHRRCF